MNDKIREKLKNAQVNEIEFGIKYKGKKIFSSLIPIEKYAEEVFKGREKEMHDFFLSMSQVLREKVDQQQQELFWERQDGSGNLVE